MSDPVYFADRKKLGERLAYLLRLAFWMGVSLGVATTILLYFLVKALS